MTQPDQRAQDPSRRPRVVMLVGNFIEGDSRVQKEARSAAEAGWDTYLVGRSKSGKREEYSLGGANVIHAAEGMAATRYRSSHPRRRLSGLIGYSSLELSKVKHQRQRLRQMDLAVERELLKRKLAEGANPLSAAAGKAGLGAHQAAVRARGYWIAARKQAFERNYEASQVEPSSPLEIRRAKRDGADGSWDAQPRLVDFEDSFGRVLDELQPDLIHANDADMLGIAARAALRARARGRTVKIVYDAHEYFAGETRKGDASWTAAMAAQERRYLPFADGVSVAAESFVEALTSLYGLDVPPTVVSNMPTATEGPALAASADPGVRELLGLGPEVPLLVHAGAVTPVRGLDTVVRALAEVPAAHFVLVAGTRGGHVADLVRLADSLGCGDRFHVLDYVEPDKLTAYLSSATLGVEPLLRTPHHDLTVTTKFWSYVNARLPILVSDVVEMARLVREMGNGEVFTAGDASAAAAAISKLTTDPAAYASVYDSPEFGRFTWESEAEKLLALYTSVTGLDPKPGEDATADAATSPAETTTAETTTEGDDADA